MGSFLIWRYHNDQQNDTQHNNTQHDWLIRDSHYKWLIFVTLSINDTHHNNTLPLCWVSSLIFGYAVMSLCLLSLCLISIWWILWWSIETTSPCGYFYWQINKRPFILKFKVDYSIDEQRKLLTTVGSTRNEWT